MILGVDSDGAFDNNAFCNGMGAQGTFLLTAPPGAHWSAGLVERKIEEAGTALAKLRLMFPDYDMD